jgi:cytochrome d ubiquinol oxidase subunit II
MAFIPFWFILIAIVWTGFFVLEGFDLGVGMLHGVIGRDEIGRRTVINTIGPLWDGNEVWLIVAGAAIFAAFPAWYATLFSGFYLAFVLLLVALILRGVSFEYRGKSPRQRWRKTWSRLLMVASLVVPLVIGIALADMLHGTPINAHQEYSGSFWYLFQPYAILTGITLVAICLMHGATFIAMKTDGPVRVRAARMAKRVAPVTSLLVLAFVSWTHVTAGGGAFLNPVELLACLAVIAAGMLAWDRREGWAFAATSVTMAICIVTIFVDLYPRVMVSSISPANDLTVHNTASPPYTLKVMTVVALVLLPIVLCYQAWSYYVFRRRITDQTFRPPPKPVAVTATGPSAAPARGGSTRGRSNNDARRAGQHGRGWGLPRGWRRPRGPRS